MCSIGFNKVGFPFSENVFQHDTNTKYFLWEYRFFSPVLLSAFLLPLHSVSALQRCSPVLWYYNLPEDKSFRINPSASVSLLFNIFFWLVCTSLKKKQKPPPLKKVLFQTFWLKNNFGSNFDPHFSPNNLSKKSCPLLHFVVLYTVTTQSDCAF